MSFLRAILCFAFLAVSTPGQAQSLCRDLFNASPELGSLNPVQQLFHWEQVANLPQMREGSQPVWVDMAIAPHNQVQTLSISSLGSNVLRYFKKVPGIFWPQHPLNTDTNVPFSNKDRIGVLKAYNSASRSFFFSIGANLFSVKIPTNRVHEHAPAEPNKTKMTSTQLQLNRSRVIQERDALLPESPNLGVLHDVASVIEKSTGSGYLVRDLTPLQDGNYYLPAFSIPYVGATIAKRFGETFENFWGTHYAQAVGRAKADLLLRYGLILTSAHPQNILVQLDPNFRPTGKIFIRDIADSVYLEQAAKALGLETEVRLDITNGRYPTPTNIVSKSHAFAHMDVAGVEQRITERWEVELAQAFTERIVSELGLDPQTYNNWNSVSTIFNTDRGVALLQEYNSSRLK